VSLITDYWLGRLFGVAIGPARNLEG
jgi:hypothetical protein